MTLKTSLRSVIYRTEKLVQAARFASLPVPTGGWPVLLGISFPKSGTHLLDQILLGFSQVAPFSRRLHSFYAEYEGETGQKRPAEQALAWLRSLEPRDVASAHLFARSEAVSRAAGTDFLSYFVFRDPRDVVVSHVFYVTDIASRHVHHDYYASLPDFEARLTTSIIGRPGSEVEFPDVAARFAPYAAWLDHPEVLDIHFEDLVNDRARTLELILDHFLRRIPLATPRAAILRGLAASINPARSPTFRSGKTGEWRRYFTSEHKRLFKSIAGDLLIRLGYEATSDW